VVVVRVISCEWLLSMIGQSYNLLGFVICQVSSPSLGAGRQKVDDADHLPSITTHNCVSPNEKICGFCKLQGSEGSRLTAADLWPKSHLIWSHVNVADCEEADEADLQSSQKVSRLYSFP
jgi:hypothetical protein